MTVRPMLWAVAVSAGLILLIAAANVAVLMLIRSRQREKELAVRLALGATSGRLAALLALEGIVIGVAATIAGLIGTQVTLRLLGASFERFLERRVPGGLDAFTVDGVVLAGAAVFGVAVTLLSTDGAVCGDASAESSRRAHAALAGLDRCAAAGPHAIGADWRRGGRLAHAARRRGPDGAERGSNARRRLRGPRRSGGHRESGLAPALVSERGGSRRLLRSVARAPGRRGRESKRGDRRLVAAPGRASAPDRDGHDSAHHGCGRDVRREPGLLRHLGHDDSTGP